MRTDRVATLSIARPLSRAGVLTPSAGVPVLMYHSVSNDAEPGVPPYYRVATSPQNFRRHLQWIREDGRTAVDLASALRLLVRDPAAARTAVVVTFDDGFRDFYTDAWPALSDFGFTATMFLPTAFIGHARRRFKGRECLTWPEVREMHAQGITFGAHTVTHPTLYGLGWSDIRRELRDSRAEIQNTLASPIDTFAYPYAFPQEDREYVQRFEGELTTAGYVAAVTTIIGRAAASSPRLLLPRLPVNDADDRSLFMSKLAGHYDWMARAQRTFRSMKTRSSTLTSAWRTRRSLRAT
jgi:peptidoglycan/xylan/chitin deacetylase (PgdA/CDA1 family)